MLKTISIFTFLLLAFFTSGRPQSAQEKSSQPYTGMSIEEFNDLCGATKNITFSETAKGGEIIYVYDKTEKNPVCQGKFTFSQDNLSSIGKE